MTLHVYGFVRPGPRAASAQPGVDAAPVRTVEHADVAALVSTLDGEEALPNRSNLLAHAHVLEGIVADEIVLPMRFGVAVDDEDALRRDVIDPTRSRILDLFERFDGSVEAIVKGFYIEDALYASILRDNVAIAKMRDKTRSLPEDATYYDRIKLGEMVHDAVKAKREQDGALIARELGKIATDIRVEEPAIDMQAAHVSILIPRDRLGKFRSLAEDLREQLQDRMKLKVMAPLPPYSFTDLSLAPTGP